MNIEMEFFSYFGGKLFSALTILIDFFMIFRSEVSMEEQTVLLCFEPGGSAKL